MDVITTLLLIAIVWMGVQYEMRWLALIGGVVLFAYVLGSREKMKPVSSGAPKIRPIIIQRKYAGPESIYPSKMKIRVNPNWSSGSLWEIALQAAGRAASTVVQALRPRRYK